MSPRQLELALRRQRLQLEAASQRRTIAEEAGGLVPLLAAGDRVRAGMHYLRQHPEWVVAAALVVVVVKPRAAFRWARRGVLVWQISRRARRGVDRLLAKLQPR